MVSLIFSKQGMGFLSWGCGVFQKSIQMSISDSQSDSSWSSLEMLFKLIDMSDTFESLLFSLESSEPTLSIPILFKKLLSVRPGLRAGSGANMALDLLPISAEKLDGFKEL
mmetsp:Transcript_9971/g.11207  ORF Transcript_9971/g.11207 Transcript_9971/m.11207 type:complete len:111 (-) Transcript_9971:249-581(-)